MHNDLWSSWSLPTFRTSSGLPYVLALLVAGFIVPEHCPAQPAAIASAEPAWVLTGNLNAARAGHTATLLLNGKVLVVGGQSSDSPIDAELYDPSTGSWSITGRLNRSRSGHTTTLLANGQVLVAGGSDSHGFDDTAELYDPDTGTWTFTGKLSEGRWLHSATLLRNGKVLVVAGNGSEFVMKCQLYDPATGAWSFTSPLERVRDSFGRAIDGRDLPQATLLQDGRVLIAGGSFDVDLYYGMPNTELYDSIAGTWRHAQDLHAPRLGHSATLLANGNVLIAGGDTAQYPFDPYRPGPVVIQPPYSTV